MIILGAHLSKNRYGYLATIAEIVDVIKGQAISIFLGNPQKLELIKFSDNEIDEIRDYVKEHKLYLFAHAKYLYNLANPYEGKYKFAIKCYVNEMNIIHSMGGIGSVIHFGKSKGMDAEEAIDNTLENIRMILKKANPGTKIILETSSGQGSEMFSKVPEIGYLWSQLETDEKKRIKFCIDTCHIFAAGYDIRTREGMKDYLEEWKKAKIGLNRFALIHFNDSATNLGSNRDRHTPFGTGYITDPDKGGNWAGIKFLIKFCDRKNIPLIIEREGGKYHDKLLKEIEVIKSHLPQG